MSGFFGSDSAPAADTTTSAVRLPADVVTSQRWAASSHRRSSTLVRNRNRSRVPDRSATPWMYPWISGWGENERDHVGLGAKEYEYSCDGTSHAAPG
jgi:hypothetical protein